MPFCKYQYTLVIDQRNDLRILLIFILFWQILFALSEWMNWKYVQYAYMIMFWRNHKSMTWSLFLLFFISTEITQSLLEENRQLKELMICKICMENEASIAMLPCGHLCCCTDCAPAMRKCPICRQFVKGTVRTWLAWLAINFTEVFWSYSFFNVTTLKLLILRDLERGTFQYNYNILRKDSSE